ncbi:aromatic acid exporter family protein [Fusibacter bizertensis]
MGFIWNKIKLGRQATLFDSYLYVLKGFLSILTGYILFHTNAIIGKDMISLLFGMMLTLEPVNIIGIKSGLDQIKASILGGVVTALLVSLFGVNAITVPLGVALTMYISLKFNWRFVSPVAIFTAIYMTQYIQLNALGEPSMLITLRLRLLALGAGIAVAIFYNFLFSKFFYHSMLKKRIVYIVESLITYLSIYIEQEEKGDLKELKKDITGLFADIDLVIGQIGDIKKFDADGLPFDQYKCALMELRDLTHYLLDVIMFRIKHDKGAADLVKLKQFSELLLEIQYLVEHKNSDKDRLNEVYQRNLSLDIQAESYLSAMHQSALGAAKCFL